MNKNAKSRAISFPNDEKASLAIRLAGGQPIFTTRASAERGKYKPGATLSSPFGPLKVVEVTHGKGIGQHRFGGELTPEQRREIGARLFDLVKLEKQAKVKTPLLPHQERVVEKMRREDQPGLVVAHGLGSGKTLTAIAVQNDYGKPTVVVAPSSLQTNYLKEIAKHTTGYTPPTTMVSMQAAARRGEVPQSDMLVVDEAHRLREPANKAYRAVKGAKAKKRLLLTGTPLYNRPYDIAPLVNVAAGESVLPTERMAFDRRFLQRERVSPGFLNLLRGVGYGTKTGLNPRASKDLEKAIKKWVDYYDGATKDFPEVSHETVNVDMTPKQRQIYDTMMNRAPFWVRAKIRAKLPLSKQESKQINAFLSAARQVSNTTGPFNVDAPAEHPKIDLAVTNLQQQLASTARGGALVYSNYLDAGINPMKQALTAAKIPFGEITGEMKKKDRDAVVKAYNAGKLRTILLSSAGGEGLDLKGTRLIQILEPHWNEQKIMQVQGRGIRYKSHAHLPVGERNVRVQHYIATKPKAGILERIGLMSPGAGVDEFLTNMSAEKSRLNDQLKEIMAQNREMAAGQEKKAFLVGHITGPSGSGKTHLMKELGNTYPGLVVKDTDDFLDHVKKHPNLTVDTKVEYVNTLAKAFLKKHKDDPVLLAGGQTKDMDQLVDKDKRWLLNTGPLLSAWRRYNRPNERPWAGPVGERLGYFWEIPGSYLGNRRTIRKMMNRGYKPMNREEIIHALGQAMEKKAHIIIAGAPGTRKSTLAKEMSKKTGMPIIHLDDLEADTGSPKLNVKDLADKLKKPHIIEGSHTLKHDPSEFKGHEVIVMRNDTISIRNRLRKKPGIASPDDLAKKYQARTDDWLAAKSGKMPMPTPPKRMSAFSKITTFAKKLRQVKLPRFRPMAKIGTDAPKLPTDAPTITMMAALKARQAIECAKPGLLAQNTRLKKALPKVKGKYVKFELK